jgi:maleylpyruvate isomerase
VVDEISQALADIQAATGCLLATATRLTDTEVGEPSLLPGWTRGHVLTHIARNADGLANLLRWASTGTEIPMYASREARDADIEAGAGRGADALSADVRDSAAAFSEVAATVPERGWTVLVRALRGDPFPASDVLARRLSEVEIHHVDLAAGYGPADWPAEFVAQALPHVAESFSGDDGAPACRIAADGADYSLAIGPSSHDGPVPLVSGPAHDVLAWLLGRSPGDGLAVHQASAVPVMPPWR